VLVCDPEDHRTGIGGIVCRTAFQEFGPNDFDHGSPISHFAGFGFLIVAMRPDLMGPAEAFRENVSAYAQAVRSARPVKSGGAVRMPFDRSRRDRARRLAEDRIDVPDVLFAQLTRIAGTGQASAALSPP